MTDTTILIDRLAFARPGDKGNDSDITVFARSQAAYDHLVAVLTADVVKAHYGQLVQGEVTRWEVPKVRALKFLARDALAGGGPSSLRADNLGKALAGAVLRLEVPAPHALADAHPSRRAPADPWSDNAWNIV